MRQTGGGLYSRFLLTEECFCMTGNYGTGILERKSDTSHGFERGTSLTRG
jgi:hypothetical protein